MEEAEIIGRMTVEIHSKRLKKVNLEGEVNRKAEEEDVMAKQSPKLNVLDVTSMAISSLNVELTCTKVMVHNPIMPRNVKKIRRFLS